MKPRIGILLGKGNDSERGVTLKPIIRFDGAAA